MFKQKLRLAENTGILADRAGSRLNALQKVLNADFVLNKKKRVQKYPQSLRSNANSSIVFSVVYNCNNLDDDISLRNLVDQ